MHDPAEAIEAIYEAAICPDLWEPALQRVAATVGCITGALTVEHQRIPDLGSATMFGYEPGRVETLIAHYWALNPMLTWSDELRPGRVLTNSMVLATSDFRRTAFYNDWAGPQGFGDALTVWVSGASEAYTTLTLPRLERLGEFTPADVASMGGLARHLGRALRIAQRLQSAEARVDGYARGLDVLGSTLLLLDEQGRIAFASPAAEALLRSGDALRVSPGGGRLAARHPGADSRLQAVLPPRRRDAGPAAGTAEIAVPGANGPVLVTVAALSRPGAASLTGEDRSGTMATVTVVVVTESARPSSLAPQVAAIAAAYGLTPAEARLVRALVEEPGAGLAAAARRAGISLNTGRTHLSRVFAKTGTRRQADVVRLVLGTPRPQDR